MTDDSTDIHQVAPDLAYAACPLEGVATAGMPRAEHFTRLATAGYTTVLDVSAPEEPRGYDEAAVVAAAGLAYVNIPVRSSRPDDATFDAVRALLRDPNRRPMLFHCQSANRVGGLLLPYLMLDEGRGQEEAINLAIQVGLRSQDLAWAALAYVGRQAGAAERA